MTVDKFGRRYYRQIQGSVAAESSSTEVSLAQMNGIFLRRDGTNSALGTINMTGNTLTNVSNPVNEHDAANKEYVDENVGISKNGDTMLGDLDMNGYRLTGLPENLPGRDSDAISWSRAVQLVRDSERDCIALKVNKSGDVMTGDLLLSADGNNDRVLGCTNLDIGRSFSIPLGADTNKLSFVNGRNSVIMETEFGFMVRARNHVISEFGSAYGPLEITIYKDVRMNSNRITNLQEPQFPHEVANKLYVDRTPRKILQGYIPSLRTTSTSFPNDKFGFVATASSHSSNLFLPSNAFNGVYSRGPGTIGEWTTTETSNFWIQIKCPDLVRVWKIALRGRDSNTQRIYNWRLEGSTDGQNYTALLEPPNPSYIGNELEYYLIETEDKYNIYRLFCLEAEPTNPGLSYMQLYVYSE